MPHTPTETYNFFLFPLINKHFAFCNIVTHYSCHLTWMNEFRTLKVRWLSSVMISEVSDSILRTFLKQCCDLSTDSATFSAWVLGIVWISGKLWYAFPAQAAGVLSCRGQDSWLPYPGWKITLPRGNDDEGKEKVAENQRADESSRCLYWIGPHFLPHFLREVRVCPD